MSKAIQWKELPKKYKNILASRLDARMNRELRSKNGLTVCEDEDFEFAEDMKSLGVYPRYGEFEMTIKDK